jgi:hypothetical protein
LLADNYRNTVWPRWVTLYVFEVQLLPTNRLAALIDTAQAVSSVKPVSAAEHWVLRFTPTAVLGL